MCSNESLLFVRLRWSSWYFIEPSRASSLSTISSNRCLAHTGSAPLCWPTPFSDFIEVSKLNEVALCNVGVEAYL